MTYQVEIDRSAVKAIRKLPKAYQISIFKAAFALGEDPRPPGHKPLHVPGHRHVYRLRVGVYRLIYQVIDEKVLVYVIQVGDRKDIYKNLLELVKARCKTDGKTGK